MKFLLTLASLVAAVSASAAVRSGHATAEWVASSSTYQSSKPLVTAIRLSVDPGWHTYWVNPGESGMKPGIKWTLPAGWTAGPVGWPVPVRFETGGLAGFGYVGEVLLPVTLTPPADASGPVTLEAKVNWLTCSDDACVPGEGALKLELKPGEPVATAFEPMLAKVAAALPKPVEGLSLEVKDDGKKLGLTLRSPAGTDPATFEVFPATKQVLDSAAPIRFAKTGETWSVSVPKSEYLEGEPESLELVLTGGGLPHPATVVWQKK
jgi:DsbC/DsbD-like thiol-disulfide interchange protein